LRETENLENKNEAQTKMELMLDEVRKLPETLGVDRILEKLKDELKIDNGNEKQKSSLEKTETNNDVNDKEELNKLIAEYMEDLKANSECPKTIDEGAFTQKDLEKLTPEEVSRRREEFDDIKGDLKKQWEKEHGIPWPKYEHDVYSANGKLIRKAGTDYDAHHIQPLAMGGKNEVKNITPIHAENHYDKQGVHSPNSPYSKMDRLLGGIE
jgi:hypothetical protein